MMRCSFGPQTLQFHLCFHRPLPTPCMLSQPSQNPTHAQTPTPLFAPLGRGPYLVAGVDGADLADVQVVEGHEQLGPQGAVVDVARAQEERPQELQHHVVELHVLPDHLRQFQNHLLRATARSSHIQGNKWSLLSSTENSWLKCQLLLYIFI